MKREKFGSRLGYSFERKQGKALLATGVYPVVSGMCGRFRKCMEVSLHYRAVRRSGIRIDLFAVSSDTWIADHGNGVFGWKGIKKQRCVII